MAVKEDDLPKGYTCACGITHAYPMYVFAHWRDELTHSCSCGRKAIIVCGIARDWPQGEEAKAKKAELSARARAGKSSVPTKSKTRKKKTLDARQQA